MSSASPRGGTQEGPQEGPQEGWQQRLRERGYRLTPQRELVLEAVNRLGHATPEEIHHAVRERSSAVNTSTVYRTLEVLEELGLVRHTHLSDRAPTYHSTTGPAHVHLVCRGCGRVDEARAEEFADLDSELQRRHGFTADIGHLTLFGTCRACS